MMFRISHLLVLLITTFLFFGNISILFADPYKPLDVEFLKSTKKKNPKKKNTQKSNDNNKKKSKKKKYSDLIKDFQSETGLFDFFWEDATGKVYLSIKPDQF